MAIASSQKLWRTAEAGYSVLQLFVLPDDGSRDCHVSLNHLAAEFRATGRRRALLALFVRRHRSPTSRLRGPMPRSFPDNIFHAAMSGKFFSSRKISLPDLRSQTAALADTPLHRPMKPERRWRAGGPRVENIGDPLPGTRVFYLVSPFALL